MTSTNPFSGNKTFAIEERHPTEQERSKYKSEYYLILSIYSILMQK